MYLMRTRTWDKANWQNDFGTVSYSTLQEGKISIERFLYNLLAKSKNAGVPIKIISTWEVRFPLRIQKVRILQAMN